MNENADMIKDQQETNALLATALLTQVSNFLLQINNLLKKKIELEICNVFTIPFTHQDRIVSFFFLIFFILHFHLWYLCLCSFAKEYSIARKQTVIYLARNI